MRKSIVTLLLCLSITNAHANRWSCRGVLAAVQGFFYGKSGKKLPKYEGAAPSSKLMSVRRHEGGLQESMATQEQIAPTIEALAASISNSLGVEIVPSQIKVKPYGYDSRIGWDTHIITIENLTLNGSVIKGESVYGFTDGPIQLK